MKLLEWNYALNDWVVLVPRAANINWLQFNRHRHGKLCLRRIVSIRRWRCAMSRTHYATTHWTRRSDNAATAINITINVLLRQHRFAHIVSFICTDCIGLCPPTVSRRIYSDGKRHFILSLPRVKCICGVCMRALPALCCSRYKSVLLLPLALSCFRLHAPVKVAWMSVNKTKANLQPFTHRFAHRSDLLVTVQCTRHIAERDQTNSMEFQSFFPHFKSILWLVFVYTVQFHEWITYCCG